MHIRSAAIEDAAAIGELITELGYPTTADAMRTRLKALISDLLVLSVSATSRGSGIGAQLVAALERWAVSRGAHDIIVNSAFHRSRAHAFYERLGYAGTGVRLV
jgi:GNAT superfamily N-acetyltransferase